MNYYEHHIGDYAQATAHLSLLEDGVYSRLIRKYYASEKPFLNDVKAVARLVGARTDEEREAVEVVLNEFFILEADGCWHNKRCDEDLISYLDGLPAREAKTAKGKERLQRHREERAQLFEALRVAGVAVAWNAPVTLLREKVATLNAPETPFQVAPATAAETPATYPQSPVPSPQTPLNPSVVESVVTQPELRENEKSTALTSDEPKIDRAVEVAKLLREKGIQATPAILRRSDFAAALLQPDADWLAAAELAQSRKPGEQISVAYLRPMVEDYGKPARDSPKFVASNDKFQTSFDRTSDRELAATSLARMIAKGKGSAIYSDADLDDFGVMPEVAA
ncbi:YdaU family protein [Janthinobacterium sp. B9-8]|uniref:YdaU family protein n=1 Tax=Janthinobacterium sp. B9-8 TaxID=1236179 RepID=UPI000699CFC9|nr:YdaU family protein [Janthinobacterium sp. B9-8]AMC34755.1 hypothetical protein VN23_09105 [Janthinobacterium sp. B9-8]